MMIESSKKILKATAWANNSAMILDMRELGYIKNTDMVLDPTYGRGKWWTHWQPDRFCFSDIKTGVDFRALPYESNTFDVVTFDPPYVAVGGRTTSTIKGFLNAYGLGVAPKSVRGVHYLMTEGLREVYRVLKPNGYCFFKSMNYVSGGKYQPAAYNALNTAIKMGFILADEFVHLREPGPQPEHIKQRHGRANFSHLFILQKNVMKQTYKRKWKKQSNQTRTL